MKKKIKKINFIHSFIFFLFCNFLSFIIIEFNLAITPLVCLISILIIGVSHGSLDHIKGRRLLKLFELDNIIIFYLTYILTAITIIILWILFPTFSLVIVSSSLVCKFVFDCSIELENYIWGAMIITFSITLIISLILGVLWYIYRATKV